MLGSSERSALSLVVTRSCLTSWGTKVPSAHRTSVGNLRDGAGFLLVEIELAVCHGTKHNQKNRRDYMKKVLFICVHNSARSQMAAALLSQMCGEVFEAHSAGLEPGTLNPLAVEVLGELGMDISKNQTQSVFDVWRSAKHIFAYVISVCDESDAQGCPIFPGPTQRLHWSFPDPSKFTGTHEERVVQTRRVLDMIHAKIDEFCAEHCVMIAA